MYARGLATALALATALPRPALADGPERAAVVAVDLGPGVQSFLTARVIAKAGEGLTAAGYTLVPPAETQATVAREALVTCRVGDCLARLATALTAQALVFASIERTGEDVMIRLRLVSATGEELASVEDLCELCGYAELEERVDVAASSLSAKAEATIARRAAAEGPGVGPGVSQPPGQPDALPIVRQPAVPGLQEGTSRPPYVALGVGVAGVTAIGLGAGLIAIDGNGRCKPGDGPVYPAPGSVIRFPDPDNPDVYVCREHYESKTAGWVSVGLGVAAVGAAVVWTVLDRRRTRTRGLALTPLRGGAVATVTLPW